MNLLLIYTWPVRFYEFKAVMRLCDGPVTLAESLHGLI